MLLHQETKSGYFIPEENPKYLTGQLLTFFGETQSKGER